jgi:uncharacterized protein
VTPGKRRARNGLIAVVVALTVWLGFSAWLTNGFLHPERDPLTTNPGRGGLPYEEVRFPSASKAAPVELSGWLIPAEGLPKGVVLLCHGRGANREAVLPHAFYLRKAGFTCLLFDFRAFGESGGDTSTIGLYESEDVLGAVAFVKGRPELSGLPLGALGVSMGGASVILAAGRSPEIRAVVADCPFATLTRAMRQRFRALLGPAYGILYVPVRFFGQTALGVNSDDVSPLNAVRNFGDRPLFLIHGTADLTILPEDSRLLHDAAPGPRELWLIPGVSHARAFSTHEREYRERVTAFFTKNLPGTGSPTK